MPDAHAAAHEEALAQHLCPQPPSILDLAVFTVPRWALLALIAMPARRRHRQQTQSAQAAALRAEEEAIADAQLQEEERLATRLRVSR